LDATAGLKQTEIRRDPRDLPTARGNHSGRVRKRSPVGESRVIPEGKEEERTVSREDEREVGRVDKKGLDLSVSNLFGRFRSEPQSRKKSEKFRCACMDRRDCSHGSFFDIANDRVWSMTTLVGSRQSRLRDCSLVDGSGRV